MPFMRLRSSLDDSHPVQISRIGTGGTEKVGKSGAVLCLSGCHYTAKVLVAGKEAYSSVRRLRLKALTITSPSGFTSNVNSSPGCRSSLRRTVTGMVIFL